MRSFLYILLVRGKTKKDNNKENEVEDVLQKTITEAVENLNVLNTESVWDFLKSKRVQDTPLDLKMTEIFINFILLGSIDSQSYDNHLQKALSDDTLTFFTEVKNLLEKSREKDKTITDRVLSHFLNLQAIKKIEKVNLLVVEKTLVDDRMLDIEAKYKDSKTIEYDTIEKDLARLTQEVKQRSEKLNQLSSNREVLVQKNLKLLNDLLQTARYIFGLLIALLDILSDRLEKELSGYFSEQNSYVSLYFRSGRFNNKLIWSSLRFYAVKSKHKEKLISIRKLIEQHLFGRYKDLRIHFAHWDLDTKQDLLPEQVYNIRIKNRTVPYTIQELKEIWNVISILFLRFKLLVAREYYSDEDLINYVRKKI